MKYVHPADIRLFKEVSDAMWHVAKTYKLPLKSIEHLEMPEKGMTDRMGQCSRSGDIHLVLRCTVNGLWEDHPISPEEVWDTAAHELCHLRHFNHGPDFQEFLLELKEAMENRRVDYRQKILDRLVKIQAQRDSEAAIGNSEAAEAFAGILNRMLLDHELNPSDIDYARGQDRDPVIEVFCNLSKYPLKGIAYDLGGKKSRIAWQETLARVVANAHLCTFLIRERSNDIIFVGTKSHATVAEYCYGNLVRAAVQMSVDERARYQRGLRAQGISPRQEKGFRSAWTASFIRRIAERLDEARKASVADVSPDLNVQSQALMRLSGALVKAQKYVDDKFSGRPVKYANALHERIANHPEGRAMGRAAADRIPLGRRGIEEREVRGKLGA